MSDMKDCDHKNNGDCTHPEVRKAGKSAKNLIQLQTDGFAFRFEVPSLESNVAVDGRPCKHSKNCRFKKVTNI